MKINKILQPVLITFLLFNYILATFGGWDNGGGISGGGSGEISGQSRGFSWPFGGSGSLFGGSNNGGSLGWLFGDGGGFGGDSSAEIKNETCIWNRKKKGFNFFKAMAFLPVGLGKGAMMLPYGLAKGGVKLPVFLGTGTAKLPIWLYKGNMMLTGGLGKGVVKLPYLLFGGGKDYNSIINGAVRVPLWIGNQTERHELWMLNGTIGIPRGSYNGGNWWIGNSTHEMLIWSSNNVSKNWAEGWTSKGIKLPLWAQNGTRKEQLRLVNGGINIPRDMLLTGSKIWISNGWTNMPFWGGKGNGFSGIATAAGSFFANGAAKLYSNGMAGIPFFLTNGLLKGVDSYLLTALLGSNNRPQLIKYICPNSTAKPDISST